MVRKFEGADGVRAVACLIVLVLHSIVLLYQGLNGYLIGIPKVGVWIFFVLSAFLLTSKFDNDGFSVKKVFSYAIGRIIRILPLYFLFCVLYRYAGTAGINNDDDLWKAVTLQGGYSHLWTIPVEFKFYLFLPVIAMAAIWSRSKAGILGLISLGVLFVLLQQYIWPYWLTPTGTAEVRWYLSCFTIGVFAAAIFPRIDNYVTGRLADMVVAAFFLIVVLVTPYMQYRLFDLAPSDYLVNKFVYLGLLCSVFMVFLVSGRGLFGRLMSSKVFSAIGRWSYPIYLVHWLIISKLYDYFSYSVIGVLLSVAVSIFAGGIIHYSIERPIDKWRVDLMKRII